jgi:hypothetical protein
MGYVQVVGADIASGKIERLRVKIPNLPARTIDRATALSWMSNGHSLIPTVRGHREGALQLVEIGEEPTLFIRSDNQPTAEDAVPGVPPVDRAEP